MAGGNGALLPALCEEDYAFQKKIVDFYMTGNSEVTDMVRVMEHYFRFLVENSFSFGVGSKLLI